MSNYTRKRQLQDNLSNTRSLLSKVEAEWADRYVEVEVDGISFRRLLCVYLAGMHDLRDRMIDGVRSLLRLDPANKPA